MKTRFEILIDIQDYWHVGNGVEGGAYADALVLKDEDHFPFLPGKSLKGLLREAFSIANQHGWLESAPAEVCASLFGQEERSGLSASGVMRVSNASLQQVDKDSLKKIPGYSSHLYTTLNSTAIDENTGTAKQGSLRSVEVALPMTLSAELSLDLNHPSISAEPSIAKQFEAWLTSSLPLITHIGGKRHRGLGPVFITAEAIGDKEVVA